MLRLKLAVVFLLLLPITCWAWDATGHALIAQIAYDQSDKETRQVISELLGKQETSKSWQQAAIWPDKLKSKGIHNFDSWHYFDQPYSPEHLAVNEPQAINIAWALEHCMKIMSQPSASPRAKAFALRFILHLAGDAHQPLHAISRYTFTNPQGDLGGNLVILTDGENLHSLWDSGLGRWPSSYNKVTIERLAKRFQRDYPPRYFTKQAQDLDYSHWLAESYTAAKDTVYHYDFSQPMTSAYLEKGQTLAEQRVVLAAYRLAALLKNIAEQQAAV